MLADDLADQGMVDKFIMVDVRGEWKDHLKVATLVAAAGQDLRLWMFLCGLRHLQLRSVNQ